ncbi:hypothetical protein Tco_0313284 [Tanacetum coccineum]
MEQPQRPADVHQDELCPPNKRYALMGANKKVDFENPLCLDESRILENILHNHPLRFSIDASSSVPWIYLGQLWHTLQEDGSKNKLKFMLDRKELTLTLDDFKTIFHLPQATDNNHDHFVPALKFSEMVPFYINNLGKSKNVVKMKIPDWIITDEMKLTKNYQLYAEVFGVDVSTTQSQPIESTQGTHRKTSVPRTPNPETVEGESNALRNLAEQKSHKELEAKQNLEKVKEHLMAEEIEKLVEGSENIEENVEVASSPLRNDENQTNLGTRLDPRSDKESLEVEKIDDISQLVNVIKEEEESVEDDYELRRREKGKHVEEIRNTPSPTTIRSLRILTNLISSDTEKLQELTKTDTIPSSSTPSSFLPKSKLSDTN